MGNIKSNDPTYTFMLDADTIFIANFIPRPPSQFTLNLIATDGGSV
jgi:hypothetical protein